MMKNKTFSKLLSVTLAFFMFLLAVPVTVSATESDSTGWDGSTTKAYSGEGTAENPYLIESAEHLAYLNSKFAAGTTSFSGQYFKLTADIDCNGKAMRLGTSGKMFGGIFDGNGHTISNFRNDVTGTPNGLFAQLSGATIRNLCVENAYIRTASANSVSGAIAGAMTANSQITGCTVLNSEVIGVAQVGGIVGRSVRSSVSDCVVSNTKISNLVDQTLQKNSTVVNGSTTEARFVVAGIMGWCELSNVTRCINYGSVSLNVEANKSGATQLFSAGGIVGHIYTGTADANAVENCVNYGSISGVTATTGRITVGGIAGRARTGSKGEVRNCYNLSTDLSASGAGTANLGMIIGCVNNSTTLTVSGNGSVPVEAIATSGNITFPVQSTSATVNNAEASGNFIASTDEQTAQLNALVSGVITAIKTNRPARVALIGVQEKTEENGTRSVRFLMGLDSLEAYSYYKFVINAEYTENGVRKLAKNGDKPLYTAYDTVYAAGEPCTALQLGTNYLGAMAVTGVPANTEVNFTVQVYVCAVGGAETLVDMATWSCGN